MEKEEIITRLFDYDGYTCNDCRLCGANVANYYIDTHLDWHRKHDAADLDLFLS